MVFCFSANPRDLPGPRKWSSWSTAFWNRPIEPLSAGRPGGPRHLVTQLRPLPADVQSPELRDGAVLEPQLGKRHGGFHRPASRELAHLRRDLAFPAIRVQTLAAIDGSIRRHD